MVGAATQISPQDARQLWASLAEEGKAPTELKFAGQALQTYSVAIGPWVDRIAKAYLQDLSRRFAHFKLAIAPYGGGKTHFLMSLGSRALDEGFAAAYVACTRGVNLDSPLDVYRAYVKALQLPGEERPGLRTFLRRIVDHKKRQIADAKAPDPDAAFALWLAQVATDDYPENTFGRVIAESIRGLDDSSQGTATDAAFRWLQGDTETLTKGELTALRLAKVPAKARAELGQNLFLSMLQFAKREADVHGTVVLFDEVETLFNAKGRALQRVLSAMRVMIDLPNSVQGGVPLLGVFSAVPDVLEQLPKYGALEQRLAVKGATFEEGNDYAIQIHLERVGAQEDVLCALGNRLIDLGENAAGHAFDRAMQIANVECLSEVAARRSLDVDARRLFVKTWVNVLQLQIHEGERRLSAEELSGRYAGNFNSLKTGDDAEEEP